MGEYQLLFGGLSRRTHGATTADRRVIHHQAATATRIAHSGEAIAATLDHRTTLGITRCTGNTATLFGHFTSAHAHGQTAATDGHSVHHATTGTKAILQHHAEVLHR